MLLVSDMKADNTNRYRKILIRLRKKKEFNFTTEVIHLIRHAIGRNVMYYFVMFVLIISILRIDHDQGSYW